MSALRLLGLLLALALALPLQAREAAPLAADEATEKRLVTISSELRCLVCQNESLAGSNAELANDLRREIRSMIRAGRSDAEITDFMVSRYGDFVLYRPPLKGSTLLLWFGPLLLLIVALAAMIRYLRRRAAMPEASPLTDEQRRQADRLLDAGDREAKS